MGADLSTIRIEGGVLADLYARMTGVQIREDAALDPDRAQVGTHRCPP